MDHQAADTKGGREVEREQREGMQKGLARKIKVKSIYNRCFSRNFLLQLKALNQWYSNNAYIPMR